MTITGLLGYGFDSRLRELMEVTGVCEPLSPEKGTKNCAPGRGRNFILYYLNVALVYDSERDTARGTSCTATTVPREWGSVHGISSTRDKSRCRYGSDVSTRTCVSAQHIWDSAFSPDRSSVEVQYHTLCSALGIGHHRFDVTSPGIIAAISTEGDRIPVGQGTDSHIRVCIVEHEAADRVAGTDRRWH